MQAEAEEVRDYRVKCLNNLAAAQLKLEQLAEALQTSRDVLTLEPDNVKALFRAGKVTGLRAEFVGEAPAGLTDAKVFAFATHRRAFEFPTETYLHSYSCSEAQGEKVKSTKVKQQKLVKLS